MMEYQPELQRISPIGQVQEIKFEYLEPERSDVRNDIKIKEHSELPDGFDLPQFSVPSNNIKIAGAPDLKKEIQADFTLSDIPETQKYSVKSFGFKMPEIEDFEVDTDVVPEIKAISYEMPEYTVAGTEDIKRGYETVSHSFEKPGISRPVLDTEVPDSPIPKEYKLPEHSAAGIKQPEISCNIATHDFSVPDFSAKIPEINIVQEVNITRFERRKTEISKLPKLNVCHVSVPEHRPIKAEAKLIPNIKIAQVKNPENFEIYRSELRLPEVSVDNFSGSNFEMPEIEKISLNTAVGEKTITAKNVEIPEYNLEIEKPSISSAEDIATGINAYWEKFNNSMISLKKQTSDIESNSLLQKEAEIP
ncbi:hypothetical protein [Ruminococcus sp.]|uniref:hypothetical protein n=1 Tax=Ruminococcus sp. TaxID=41978 RepID=UPI0025FD43DB|nr:hypothetical protein [Ruminococcus sp.]